MIDGYLPVAVVVAAAVVLTAQRRLRAAVQPLRIELAEKGERLLASETLPPQLRKNVTLLLNSAFGCRAFLLFALCMVPLLAIILVAMPSRIGAIRKELTAIDPETKVLYSEVDGLHDRIMFANHPLMATLVQLEMVILVSVALILRSLIFGRVPASGGREDVMNEIESRMDRHFWKRHRAAA